MKSLSPVYIPYFKEDQNRSSTYSFRSCKVTSFVGVGTVTLWIYSTWKKWLHKIQKIRDYSIKSVALRQSANLWPLHGASSRWQWSRRPTDTDDSCENTEIHRKIFYVTKFLQETKKQGMHTDL